MTRHATEDECGHKLKANLNAQYRGHNATTVDSIYPGVRLQIACVEARGASAGAHHDAEDERGGGAVQQICLCLRPLFARGVQIVHAALLVDIERGDDGLAAWRVDAASSACGSVRCNCAAGGTASTASRAIARRKCFGRLKRAVRRSGGYNNRLATPWARQPWLVTVHDSVAADTSPGW